MSDGLDNPTAAEARAIALRCDARGVLVLALSGGRIAAGGWAADAEARDALAAYRDDIVRRTNAGELAVADALRRGGAPKIVEIAAEPEVTPAARATERAAWLVVDAAGRPAELLNDCAPIRWGRPSAEALVAWLDGCTATSRRGPHHAVPMTLTPKPGP